MFYNTGIATYIWILSNHKPAERRGKVQLIDATNEFEKLRKNLGDKRAEISQVNLENIVRTYHSFEPSDTSKIFKTTDFGYTTITVERPLRLSWALRLERIENALSAKAFEKLSAGDRIQLEDALNSEVVLDSSATTDVTAFTKRIQGAVSHLGLSANQIKNLVAGLAEHDDEAPLVKDAKGRLVADSSLRDTENVPLNEDIEAFAATEIAPHLPEFWLDRSKDKVGYEIPFTRHFYKYEAPRPLEEIDADLNKLIADISQLLIEIEK
jgi:type I restriction enzyme M protein